MQPLSNDLRQRILDAVDNHEGSRRKLAARFKVNTSTITRLLQLRRQTGSSQPRPHGGGVAPTLDRDALERLRGLVEETPDATLDALRQEMGVPGSRMIICRALQQLGLPRKKKSPHAAERDTPGVREERREFAEGVEAIEPKRLVFVDETGVTTAMTPAYGRAGVFVMPLPPYSPEFNPIEKNQADCTSSDRWCKPLGAGYDRHRRAARTGRVVPTAPHRDIRREPMPATARRIVPPRT